MSQPLPSPPSAQSLNLPDVHSCQTSMPAQVHPSCQVLVVVVCLPGASPQPDNNALEGEHQLASGASHRPAGANKEVQSRANLLWTKTQPGSAPMHPNPTATQIWLHAPFLLGDYMKNQGPGRHKTELRFFPNFSGYLFQPELKSYKRKFRVRNKKE